MNKLAKLMRNTGPARFFVPLGVILIVFGIFTLGQNTKDYVETTGVITKVEACVPVEDEPQQYDVYVAYTVDGENYGATFPNLTGDYKEGDAFRVFYDPADPKVTTNSRTGSLFSPILIVAGLAALAFGVLKTVKAFQKSRELDESAGSQLPASEFDGFRTAPGVKEYYFRIEENHLKPVYLMEDANRKVLYEGKMTQNSLVSARSFEFYDHTTGSAEMHEIGHTITNSYSDEFFSITSTFKFDGKDVWDVLHERGLRLTTDMRSKFPKLVYFAARGGSPFAVIETSSRYVHEDEESEHRLAVPAGKFFYRCWTASEDMETVFLTVFAISETDQTVVE